MYCIVSRSPIATELTVGVMVQLVVVMVQLPLETPFTRRFTVQLFPVPGVALTLAVNVPKIPATGEGICLDASVPVDELIDPNAPYEMLFVLVPVMPPASSVSPAPDAPVGPAAPSAPAGPCAPSAPAGPAGPIAPSAPVGPSPPAGPCAPSAPAGPPGPWAPSAPAGPGSPCGPIGPVSPDRTSPVSPLSPFKP